MSSNKVVCLHKLDNVCVALSDLKMREIIHFNGHDIQLIDTIYFGHKIALKTIEKGEPIIKYGVPIGSATKNISKGSHVHTQNMESLYMKQFTK